MSLVRITPILEAYLPESGAQVSVSDDFSTLAVTLDLPLDGDGEGGEHLLELSLGEAVNLSAALLQAIQKTVDHREVQRIAEEQRRQLEAEWESKRTDFLPKPRSPLQRADEALAAFDRAASISQALAGEEDDR